MIAAADANLIVASVPVTALVNPPAVCAVRHIGAPTAISRPGEFAVVRSAMGALGAVAIAIARVATYCIMTVDWNGRRTDLLGNKRLGREPEETSPEHRQNPSSPNSVMHVFLEIVLVIRHASPP